MYEDIDPLHQALNDFSSDPIAFGLLKTKNNAEFVGAIHVLKWVLPPLEHLSKTVQ